MKNATASVERPNEKNDQPGNHSKTFRTSWSLDMPQVSMGNMALSFRRWNCSSILRITVSPLHKYRSKPSLYFYRFCFK